MTSPLRFGIFIRPTGFASQLIRQRVVPILMQNMIRRGYVSEQFRSRYRERLILNEYGLLDDYVPLPRDKRPSIFSKAGFRAAVKHWKSMAATTLAIGMLRMKQKDWRPKSFAQEAQEIYKTMNDAFAKGDRETLKVVCTPSMFSQVKNDLKRRTETYRWSMHGEVEPPRVVSARFGRLGKDLHLFQVTVRLHTKQAMAIYTKKGQAIAGHPNKTQDILEYIVFERTIGGDNTNDWRIYGRVYEKPIIDI